MDWRQDAKREDSRPSTQAPKRAPWSCVETGTSPGSDLCVRHSRPLDSYCCTDEQVICALCASAEHMGHTIGYVREERRRKQKELSDVQTKSKQILREQEKKCKNMGKTLKQIQEEGSETQDYCEIVLVGIIDSLQRHYMSVRELIRGHEEEAAAQVQASLQKVEEMRKRDDELDHLAQTVSDVHFLQDWPSMQRLWNKDRLHRLHRLHEDSEDPLLRFEFTKRAVNQLAKQLEEFCDSKFASLSQTADIGEQQESEEESEEDDMQQRCEASYTQSHGFSGGNNMTEHSVEPKTREEFLQYACCLSLDPATAHEDLVISAGGKEVRLSPSEFKSSAARFPHRFLHRRQVLCREGLQAERCYYEIEVKGDKAEIALAYRGIDRRSRTRLSAFGATESSWSLDRSANYSVSHRAESVQLTTCPSQRRLGVYLNFAAGALSFYEVSDRMTFLYKVEAEFTEPLYPGFWLGENCCISICDLSSDR
ncbi:tripartite motif-containing protein 16-like isoform X2 [Cebidichthys violaceus]|uniref:tripartite motif-containing protein 16-like isoform X2 n=1 Tax=Cebidichthys violaceus TaxID=271503 RepID=UPI0035CABFAA